MRRINHEDIIGKRFNMLTIIGQGGRERGERTYLCRCDCGKLRTLRASRIVRGEQQSCGCLRQKHGWCHANRRSREWLTWSSLKGRCENPKCAGYERYGARGIVICERWRNSFANFISDMGMCPEGFQIDRIDNDGNYEPSNCRWVNRRQNMNNRSCSRRIKIDGIERGLAEWCEIFHAPYSRTRQRISRGWDPIKALKEPPPNGPH